MRVPNLRCKWHSATVKSLIRVISKKNKKAYKFIPLQIALLSTFVKKEIMKKSLLILVALAFALAGHSQFIELNGEVNTVLGTSTNTTEVISAHWDVINISGSQRDIRCRREIIQNVAGAEHQFCWGEICGPWAIINELSTETVTLADGDSSFSFYCKYRHNGNPGQSTARFCWFDAADPSNSLCYDVNFCVDAACIIGVNEIENQASLQILGNPVSELSGISYSFAAHPSQAELLIYSATGMLVADYNLASAQGVVLIDANQMANGIYTCKLNENGRTVGIQRMVVSK